MMTYDATTFEVLLNVALGLGLAAACGFRIFVPMLVLGGASASGYLQLSESFSWIGTTPALIIFGVATALEIGAYFIPWLDNALDTVGAPAAVVAGTVVAASAITGMDPMLKWSLALIAGGGAAGTVHGGLALLRAGSTAATGGLANPLISAAESGGSILLSFLAILVPFAGLAIVLAALYFGGMIVRRVRGRGVSSSSVAPA